MELHADWFPTIEELQHVTLSTNIRTTLWVQTQQIPEADTLCQ